MDETIKLSWLQKLSVKVLSQGPIPKHVGFILDGNRRWAKENSIPMKNSHDKGNTIFKCISVYMHMLGVEEVTGFVFSLDNFSRSEEEVDLLLQRIEKTADEFIRNSQGMRIRFKGQISLLPEALQRKIVICEEMTKNNAKEKTLNVAVAYTCQDDITQAMKAVLKQDSDSKEISVDLMEKSMFCGPSSDVDLILRTSGETRLSNFMMWEVSMCSSQPLT